MTSTDSQRIVRLFRLADGAADLEFLDLELVNHFSELREEHGLAKLLLLIEEYFNQNQVNAIEIKVENATQKQNQTGLQTHQTIQSQPDPDAMQRM